MQAQTEKKVSTLPIMEHFATIQGEGAHTGTPAYFIRTGGCDVGCHWCDVKESWPMETHAETAIEALVGHVTQAKLDVCVVTGGEPTMYDLQPLTDDLHDHGVRTHIETSGVYPLTGDWDWVTFSPKKFKAPQPDIYKKAHELKVVIFHPSDFAFAEEHAAEVSKDCQLFLQPEWSKREKMMPEIVAYVKDHPQWRISLQTHKYLNIP